MSDNKDSVNQAVEFFNEMIERTGATVSSVKDGFLLGFKRQYLRDLLEQNPDAEKLIIFVKKPTKENN